MSFSLTGFGAEALRPLPQTFQALSLGGSVPVPPAPPYGTPNEHLVPVVRTGTPVVPANLTLAAQPVFAAILRINSTVVARVNQPISARANTTSAVDANDPSVAHQVQVNTSQNENAALDLPQGEVSFNLTQVPAYVTSDGDAFAQTVTNLKLPVVARQPTQNLPSQPVQQPIVPQANASSVARVVSTVRQLAISAVYPAPVFSFSA